MQLLVHLPYHHHHHHHHPRHHNDLETKAGLRLARPRMGLWGHDTVWAVLNVSLYASNAQLGLDIVAQSQSLPIISFFFNLVVSVPLKHFKFDLVIHA